MYYTILLPSVIIKKQYSLPVSGLCEKACKSLLQ